MENKKTKLTISGEAKKSIKNIEIAKTQGKNSVVIEKSKSNFVKKGSPFKSSGAGTKPKSKSFFIKKDLDLGFVPAPEDLNGLPFLTKLLFDFSITTEFFP